MASGAAERQRRYRRHKQGDHSLCLGSASCQDTPTGVTSRVTPAVTRDALPFGPRARRLWADMGGDDAAGARRVLLEEACRLADRLDVLDRILRGDEDSWIRLHSANEDGSIVKVVLNNALAEARQQQVALKQLVAELRQGATNDEQDQGDDILDQLAAQRAKRLADTAGR